MQFTCVASLNWNNFKTIETFILIFYNIKQVRTHACTYTHTHQHTHERTHARARMHTRTLARTHTNDPKTIQTFTYIKTTHTTNLYIPFSLANNFSM